MRELLERNVPVGFTLVVFLVGVFLSLAKISIPMVMKADEPKLLPSHGPELMGRATRATERLVPSRDFNPRRPLSEPVMSRWIVPSLVRGLRLLSEIGNSEGHSLYPWSVDAAMPAMPGG